VDNGRAQLAHIRAPPIHAARLKLGVDRHEARAADLSTLSLAALALASTVVERYADQQIGIADASNVILAARYRTRTIATLDHRHFDALRQLGGGRFTIVP
jgi:predicted nucleic acid-binding protein